MNFAEDIIGSASYLAHGYCLLWQPWLVALHAVPDFFIFLAYTSIPIALLKLLRMRPELAEYRGLLSLFAAFILLCGLTHLVGLLTLWFPIYPIHGAMKALTAVVSVVTALALVPLIPRLASIPSPAQMRAINTQLRAEITSHEQTMQQLSLAQRTLESRVAERTQELEESNARLNVMARETVHRSNNLLTQVQSLARQSTEEGEDAAEVIAAFDGRVGALARATTVVLQTPGGWTANIASVVATELAELSPAQRDRIEVSGPDMPIRIEAAQQIALLIYEILQQSRRSGALSGDIDTAELSWKHAGNAFLLSWVEPGAQDWIANLPDTGISARLLLQSIPMTLHGSARLHQTEGVGYTLELPIDALHPQDRTESIDHVGQAYPRTPSRLAKPAQSE